MLSHSEWQSCLEKSRFDLQLDNFDTLGFSGYLPAVLAGEDVGFEYYFESLPDCGLELELADVPLEERDSCIGLSIAASGGDSSVTAALIAASVLAKATDGLLWIDGFVDVQEALRSGRQALENRGNAEARKRRQRMSRTITKFMRKAGYTVRGSWAYKTLDPSSPIFWAVNWHADEKGHQIRLGTCHANCYLLVNGEEVVESIGHQEFILTPDGVQPEYIDQGKYSIPHPDMFWTEDQLTALGDVLPEVENVWAAVWGTPTALIDYNLAREGCIDLPAYLLNMDGFWVHSCLLNRRELAMLHAMIGDFENSLHWAEKDLENLNEYESALLKDLRKKQYKWIPSGEAIENNL